MKWNGRICSLNTWLNWWRGVCVVTMSCTMVVLCRTPIFKAEGRHPVTPWRCLSTSNSGGPSSMVRWRLWHPGSVLNRIDRILISTSCNFFSENSPQRNSGLSVLGLERFGDGWPTRKSFPGAHEWGQSVHKRLVLVCGASLEILESCQG
jgi:hypothetical protein